MNIGEQIRKYRSIANISQKELGKRLGMSQQQIAQYENGNRKPKFETLKKIGDALEIDILHLLPEGSYKELPLNDDDKFLNVKHKYFTEVYGEIIEEKTFDEILLEYWNSFSEKERDRYLCIALYFSKLNNIGTEKAVERIQELCEIKRYRKDGKSPTN